MLPNLDQPDPKPIFGFVAGTPLLTPEGHRPIEQVRPGDSIQSTSNDNQPESPEPPRWWERN